MNISFYNTFNHLHHSIFVFVLKIKPSFLIKTWCLCRLQDKQYIKNNNARYWKYSIFTCSMYIYLRPTLEINLHISLWVITACLHCLTYVMLFWGVILVYTTISVFISSKNDNYKKIRIIYFLSDKSYLCHHFEIFVPYWMADDILIHYCFPNCNLSDWFI